MGASACLTAQEEAHLTSLPRPMKHLQGGARGSHNAIFFAFPPKNYVSGDVKTVIVQSRLTLVDGIP